MTITTLGSGNDTVYLYEGFIGGINTANPSLDLLNVTLDGGSGSDTLVVDDIYPSTHFKLTTSTTGVATLSTASGFLSLQNFEKIQFKNTSLSLLPTVSSVPTASNDSLTGTSGADNLSALAGNDTITALAGNDILDGGTGVDTLIGGLGNDTYVIDTTSDVVSEAAGAGKDLVKVAVATAGGTYTLAANVENATLVNTVAYKLSGNPLANTLIGNAAANVLDGGAGNDLLVGGAGSDTFVFGTPLAAASNVDTLRDYDIGGTADRIFLDDSVFTALGILGSSAGVALDGTPGNATKFCVGPQATGAEDRIIYDQTSGKLYYDPTGSANGATDQVQFALIGSASTHPALTAADFFII